MTCDTDLAAVTVTRNSRDAETGTDAATDDPAVPVNNDTSSDTTADTVIENNSSLSRFFCQFCDIRSSGSDNKGSEHKRKRQYGTFKKVKICEEYE